jgi:DNA-binding GntR family transcriptional regulator
VDVYAALLEEITTWSAPPGAALREEDLAARLGVSRTPVREALARLRADGLVEQRPGQIATVAPVGVDTTVAVYQARDALESYAVQLAARSVRRDLFTPLQASYAAFADTRDEDRSSDRLFALTDDFDDALGQAVANPYLLGPLQSTRAALVRLRRLAALHPTRMTEAARQRAAECHAIATGDAETAGRLSHDRIGASLQHVLETLAADRAAPFVPPPLG